MGCSCCLHAGVQTGVIILEFVLFSGVPRRGCGIQRTLGDEVMVENGTKNISPVVLMYGVVLSKGGVLSSVLHGTPRKTCQN